MVNALVSKSQGQKPKQINMVSSFKVMLGCGRHDNGPLDVHILIPSEYVTLH